MILSKKNIFQIFYKILIYILILFINCILLLLLLPVLILLLISTLLTKNRKKNKSVFFVGLEHIINKTVVRAEYFRNLGFKCYFYSFEKINTDINIIPKNSLIKSKDYFSFDILNFFFTILKYNPVYIELYFEGLGIRQFFFSIICKVYRIPIASIHRGIASLYYNNKFIKNYIRKITYNRSNLLLYRDPKMFEIINKLNLHNVKVIYDFNRVKIKDEYNYYRTSKNILFLNSIQNFRRIEIFINSIPYILKYNSDAVFFIIGCRNKQEFDNVNYLVKKANIASNVIIEYWTNKPYKYYEKASIFVLPSDIVFCNFSLIECMERGVPAVVAAVDDADLIIKHGVNGFLAKQTPEDFAKYINILLDDDDLRIRMGKEARKIIIDKFNDKDRMIPILHLIENKFPELFPK